MSEEETKTAEELNKPAAETEPEEASSETEAEPEPVSSIQFGTIL